MNRWKSIVSATLMLTAVAVAAVESECAIPLSGGRVPGVLIVQLARDVVPQYTKRLGGSNVMGIQSLDVVNAKYGLESFSRLFPGAKPPTPPRNLPDLTRFHRLHFGSDADLDEAAATYRIDPNVASVEFDSYVFALTTPDDSLYPAMWNLNQESDHDVDADQAWDVHSGSPAIILGVTDTGVLYSHEDLNDNIWVNPGEDLDGNGVVYDSGDMNGIDDDGNGYVDDLIGWDFVETASSTPYPPWPGEDSEIPDNNPEDFHGHGTHVSGTIAAATNNTLGVSGLAGGFGSGHPGCKIMCLRMGWSISYYGTEYGITTMSYVAEAFVYGANMGVRAINYSYGSGEDGGIAAATDYAVGMGVTICAAAGNDGAQSNYGYLQSRPDVICIASTDQSDGRSYFSNYGGPVDISAPGSDIWSTISFHRTPGYASMSGTSMATPHVVGITGLILSVNPGLTREQVLEIIQATADSTTNYVGFMGAGRINAHKAVQEAKAFRISHVPLGSTADTLNPYEVVATIVSDTTLVADSLSLLYRSSAATDTDYVRLPLIPTGNLNEYAAWIPPQPPHSTIEYGLTAQDDHGERVTAPPQFPDGRYSFRILGIPVLFSYPSSFQVDLPSGYTTVETLIIRNDGTDDLLFTLGTGGIPTSGTAATVEAILRANETVPVGISHASYKGEPGWQSSGDQPTAADVLASRSRYASSSASVLRAAVLDSWGTDAAYRADWDYLNAHYGDFGITPIVIDYSTFNHEGITYGELAANGPDVLIISDAWDYGNGWQFTPSEMAAIRQYVNEGHGLYVTGGTLDYEWAPAHMAAFAALLGLDSTRAYQWSSVYSGSQYLRVANHPLFKNIPDPYSVTYEITDRPLNGVWASALSGAELIAVSNDGLTATTAYSNRVYTSVMPEEAARTGQTPADHQFQYNAILYCASALCDWLSVSPVSGTIPPHDSVLAEVQLNATSFHQDTTLNCQINLSALDSAGSQIGIPVSVHVLPPLYYVSLSPQEAAQTADARDTVWYTDTLTNYGALDDHYTLTMSGSKWPTTTWDSSRTSEIAVTPVMSMNSRYVIHPRVVIPDGAAYGLQDTLRLVVQSTGDPLISATFEATTGSEGRPDSIPWLDQFVSPVLDTLLWQFPGGGAVSELGVNPPSPPYSLNVSGDYYGRDSVTSVRINLEGQTQVALSYWFEQGGFAGVPGYSDDLVFEVLDSSLQWVEVSRQFGTWTQMTSFRYVEVLLPRSAFHRDFRLRIRSSGSWCQCDDWFVDDVSLYAPIPPSICYTPDSFAYSLSGSAAASDSLVICNNGPGTLKYVLGLRDSALALAGTAFPRIVPGPPGEGDGLPVVAGQDATPPSLLQSPPLSTTSMGLRENFEDGDYAGWIAGTGSHVREVTDVTAAAGSRYSLSQTGGMYSYFDGVWRNFPANTYQYAGFYIRLNSSWNNAGYVVIGDQNTSWNYGAIFFYANDQGRFTVYPGDASFPYQTHRWYKVEFFLNWEHQSFDYYVDGRLIASNLPFRNPTAQLSQIHLFNYYYNPTAWWDEIVIADGPMAGGWLSAWPARDSIMPGESSLVSLRINSAEKAPGSYLGHLEISSNDPFIPLVDIPVSLKVMGPEIELNPVAIADSISEGSLLTDTIWVHNVGEEPLYGRTLGSSDDWLSVEASPYFPGPHLGTPGIPNPKSRPEGRRAASLDNADHLSPGIAPGDSVPLVVHVSAEFLIAGEHCGNILIGSNDFDERELAAPVCVHTGPDPRISVTPESLIAVLDLGDSTDNHMEVHNNGAGTLAFSVSTTHGVPRGSAVQPRVEYPSWFYNPVSKDAPDTRMGHPVVTGIGGPDSGGYQWIDSDEPGGPAFQWVEIQTTGTVVPNVSDDNYYGPFQIGFEFPFYDSTYSTFWISSNGFIGFGPPTNYWDNYNMPMPYYYSPNNTIAWYWDDLYPTSGTDAAQLIYKSGPDQLVVEFLRFRLWGYPGGPWITGEIILQRDGSIIIQTKELQPGFYTGSASVGLENETGTIGLGMAFNTNYTHSNQAIAINRSSNWLTVAPPADTVPPGGTIPLTARSRSAGARRTDQYASIRFESNDPGTATLTVPARLHVRAPVIDVSRDSLTMDAQEGMTTDSTITIQNSGDGILHASLHGDSVWLSSVPDSVSIPVGGSMDLPVRVNAAGLIAGNYTAVLTIRSDDMIHPVWTIPVSVQVGPDPEIAVTPETLSVVISAGDSLHLPLLMENLGAGTLAFAIETQDGTDSVALWQQLSADSAAVGARPSDLPPQQPATPGTFGPANSTRRFALVEDYDPYGGYRVRQLLTAHGIAYDIWGSSEMGYADLSQYDKVVIMSYQSSWFYTKLSQNREWFNDYVRGGGNLEMNLGDDFYSHNLVGLPLPGGFTIGSLECFNRIQIVDPLHPLLTTPNHIPPSSLNYWGCSAVGSISTLPDAATVILRDEYTSGVVCAEVRLGEGTILTTTQPVEPYWAYYPYLENILLYHSRRAPWLSISPASGRLSPHSDTELDVRIRSAWLGSRDAFGRFVIRTNDPVRPVLEVPVHLHQQRPEIQINPPDTMTCAVSEGVVTLDSVWIFNRGDANLTFEGSVDASWVSLNPVSSGIPAGDSLAVVVALNVLALVPGDYQAGITITSNDPDHRLAFIQLIVDIGPDPSFVLPDSLIVAVTRGDSIAVPFVISNSGPGTLRFQAESLSRIGTQDATREPYPASYYHRIGKGERDDRVGHPVTLGKGGPDSAGYRWIDSDEPGGPFFNWVDISATGIQVDITYHDQVLGPFPAGFAFPFYSGSYNEFWISANGFIGFGPPDSYYAWWHDPIPSYWTPNNIIAWCWADLYPVTDPTMNPTQVFYKSEPERLIVQFERFRSANTYGSSLTAQIILTRQGQMTIQYLDIEPSFCEQWSTVGIEDASGTAGLEVAFNTTYLHDSLAIRFLGSPDWLTIAPDTGRIAPNSSMALNAHINGFDLSEPEYFAVVLFESNDPAHPTKSLPVRLEVLTPHISVIPESLVAAVAWGDSATGHVGIGNAGQGILKYSAAIEQLWAQPGTPGGVVYPPTYYESRNKGEPDSRTGTPKTLGSGGPDGGGYQWVDSDAPGGPTFHWIELGDTGTVVYGLGDDNCVGPFAIGFPFPYYDTIYSEFWISSNGFIGFGPTDMYETFSNMPIPTATAPNNVIAWHWTDMISVGGSSPTVTSYHSDTSRLVIQFTRARQYCCQVEPWITAEIILYRDGRMLIQYNEVRPEFPSSSLTIGIESPNGSTGLEVAFNAPYVHSGLAVLFARSFESWLSLIPESGRVNSDQVEFLTANIHTAGLGLGDHYARIWFHSNDPDRAYVAIPVHLVVTKTLAAAASIPGDFTGDGILDAQDIHGMLRELFPATGKTDSRASSGMPAGATVLCHDLNGDGVADIRDAVILIQLHWQGRQPAEDHSSSESQR